MDRCRLICDIPGHQKERRRYGSKTETICRRRILPLARKEAAMETYESMRSATLAALDDDDYETAFRTFRVAIDYTFQKLDGSASQFADAFGIFARISERFANQEFVARVRSVADQPNDIQRLYDLAYLLYEDGHPGIGATALARADELAPGQMPIIAELVSALEACGLCAAAVDVLRKYPKLTGSEFVLAYQLAFNSLMSGDLDTTRRTFDTMPGLAARTSDHDVMINRIRGFLTRADQVRQVCPLDLEDLRGWHYVTTGGILTHLSPYGYSDPMRGRFAMMQDSLARIRLGISNLKRVIESKKIPIDSVTPLDDRASRSWAPRRPRRWDTRCVRGQVANRTQLSLRTICRPLT